VKARRYQLDKHAVAIVAGGHPWIFRDRLSSAASVFRDGQWLRLVDGANRVVGHGIYEAEGAIAIRVLRRGPTAPDAAWLRGALDAALARRAELAATTDGIRLVHGESDGVPAVVADRFGDAIVVASYAGGADALARYVARVLAAAAGSSPVVGPARDVIVRPVHRRRGARDAGADDAGGIARVVRGAARELVAFVEDGERYTVDLASGHKTGAYLDLRGLRRAVRAAPLEGARVLNLFAYTGALGRAAELAGATTIVQVDASARALALASAHHVGERARHRFVEADVFDWLAGDAGDAPYQLVIVDPPAMTSRAAQVPAVLAAYRRLYRLAARRVAAGGAIIAACCTSRVARRDFHATVAAALGPEFVRERELAVEPDHPVAFAQADYLKIGWWRRRAPL
jgi:23S rRNA G2069 N7-methylase RlmK/C1962 C5-methylase RlmI